MRCTHRFLIELLRENGETVGRADVDPDWDPAVECARFAGLRTLGVWAPEASAVRGVRPVWDPRRGEPYVRGFSVDLAAPGDSAWQESFPAARYFGPLARAAATQLVAEGVLKEGERFRYRTLAYARASEDIAEGPAPFDVVERPQPLRIRERETPDCSSTAAGDTQTGDFDVFIPAGVLEEASALTRQAGDVETGGILIGHLTREQGATDVGVEVTALIPARHTVRASTTLTFTSDTWTDVRRAVELRRREELLVGWFHSHPQLTWCREKGCPLEQQRACAAADGFFSADDLALHRTMFPRAFAVALVMTHSVKGVLPRLFGWRSGCFEPRGFRVIAEPAITGESNAASSAAV